MAGNQANTIDGLYGVVMERTGPLDDYALLLPRVSAECQVRAARFRRRMDGENTVLGELLLRALLETLLAPSAITLGRDPLGKPFWREKPGIHVSISHSGGFVACAAAPAPVGIDVQVADRAPAALVRRFFAPEEAKYVLEGTEETQALRFCRIWAMKESYIKRDGRGLRIPLPSFDVLALQQERPMLFREIPLAPRAACQICCEAPRVGGLYAMAVHDFLREGLPLAWGGGGAGGLQNFP